MDLETLTSEDVPVLAWSLWRPADPGRSEQCRVGPVTHQHGFYPGRPGHWPHRRFRQWLPYLQHQHSSQSSLWSRHVTGSRTVQCRGAPLVRLYISLTASVERSLSGWPLSPPTSDLWRSWSVSGLDTVVLETIKPSTPSWEQRGDTQSWVTLGSATSGSPLL